MSWKKYFPSLPRDHFQSAHTNPVCFALISMQFEKMQSMHKHAMHFTNVNEKSFLTLPLQLSFAFCCALSVCWGCYYEYIRWINKNLFEYQTTHTIFFPPQCTFSYQCLFILPALCYRYAFLMNSRNKNAELLNSFYFHTYSATSKCNTSSFHQKYFILQKNGNYF